MPIEKLLKLAHEAMRTVSAAPERLPAPLVYVLQTAKGNTHIIINDEYQAVLALMEQTKDRAVKSVLAMWKDGIVDVPSYAFRRALLELDASNAQTQVFVMTGRGYAVKAVKNLM